MQNLRVKALSFSKELQGFSQDLTAGIEEVKRAVKAKPCVGASDFRGSLQNLNIQADSLDAEVNELKAIAFTSPPLKDILKLCITELEDNKSRIEVLEAQLREYGYAAVFAAAEPDKDTATLPEVPGSAKDDAANSREASALRGTSVGEGNTPHIPVREEFRMPLVTPSPIPSSIPSIDSISPSLRELQLKYGQSSLTESSPEAIQSLTGPNQPGNESPDSLEPMHREPAPVTGAQAEIGSTDVCGGSSFKASSRPEQPGRVSYTGSPKAEDGLLAASRGLTIITGKRPGPAGDTSSPKAPRAGNITPVAKSDIISTRLAAGEPPWDMLSLKAAINAATAGSGEVGEAIAKATFHPQAAAFTSLLHMCAKHKLWDKALEVFEGMTQFHPAVVPNTVHFSSLISACGTAGRWQEAMRVFEEMKAHSTKDAQCAPNVITYSALMTACCAGGRPDKAHEAFRDMKARGIQPDHISYSTLIAGYERWGDLDTAKSLFEEMMEAGLLQKGPAAKMPSYLEQFNRKLMRTTSKPSQEESDGKGAEHPGHRVWNSFGSNGGAADSPYIGAHYGSAALSRRTSAELARAEDDSALLQQMRSPSHGALFDTPKPAASSQRTPLVLQPRGQAGASSAAAPQLAQASRSSRLRGRTRSSAPSPLSHSFDERLLPSQGSIASGLTAPPGFAPATDAPQASGIKPVPGHFGSDPQTPLTPGDTATGRAGGVEALTKQLASMPGFDIEIANQLLGAIVQNQAASPLPVVQPETFLPASVPTPTAANGAPQIAQITVQEYNNLPLRFSRQLSFDQMNDAVDYINAVVEGKQANDMSHPDAADGITPQELVPLELGNQRTTALLNCLLQLKRVRLTVRDGKQHCQLLRPG